MYKYMLAFSFGTARPKNGLTFFEVAPQYSDKNIGQSKKKKKITKKKSQNAR